jgi:hypothetical protein
MKVKFGRGVSGDPRVDRSNLVPKSAGVEIDGACIAMRLPFSVPTERRIHESTDNRTCGSARAVPLGSPHPGEPLVPEFLNSLERGLMALANPFVESKSLP